MSAFCTTLILLISAQTSWALRAPRTQAELREVAAIADAIAKETALYRSKMDALNDDLEKAKRKVDGAAVLALVKQDIDRLNVAHGSAMTRIIQRTVRLYDINPAGGAGRVVTGHLRSREVVWMPVYAPERSGKSTILPNGVEVRMQARGPYAGMVWGDGSVELNDKAFLSPGYLAAVIYHEAIHFEQLTTPGRGDRLTPFRAEIEAHSQSTSRAAISAFGLTKDDITRLKGASDSNIRAFQNTPAMGMMSMQFSDGDKYLEEKQREAQELVEREKQKQQRMNMELALRGRGIPPPSSGVTIPGSELRPASPSPERGGRPPTRLVSADSSAVVRAVASLACQNPSRLSDEVLAYLGPGTSIPSADLERRGLSGCQLAVFDAMVALIRGAQGGSPVTTAWLAARVAETRPRPVSPTVPHLDDADEEPTRNTPNHDKPWDVYRRFRDDTRLR